MYGVMLVSSSVASLPFVFNHLVITLIWVLFVGLVIYAIGNRWRAQTNSATIFSVQNNRWVINNSGGDIVVVPCGDFLLWSWLIVIPLREENNRKKYYLVAMPDSMDKDDWRRLRVWLRTGLHSMTKAAQ